MATNADQTVYPIRNRWLWKPLLSYVIIIPFLLTLYNLPADSSNSTAATPHQRVLAYLVVAIVALPLGMLARTLQRRAYRYSAQHEYLELAQGVIRKQQRNMPYGVIQNITITQTLSDRIFGITTLKIENSSQGGGSTSSSRTVSRMGGSFNRRSNPNDNMGFLGNVVQIPGLAHGDAQAFKEILLQKMKDHPLEDTSSGL